MLLAPGVNFTNMFTRSFYESKKSNQINTVFLGSAFVKVARNKTFVKSNPGFFYVNVYFFLLSLLSLTIPL